MLEWIQRHILNQMLSIDLFLQMSKQKPREAIWFTPSNNELVDKLDFYEIKFYGI